MKRLFQIGGGTHLIDCVSDQIEATEDLCNKVNTPDKLLDKTFPNINQILQIVIGYLSEQLKQ